MATTKDYKEFILDELSLLDNILLKKYSLLVESSSTLEVKNLIP